MQISTPATTTLLVPQLPNEVLQNIVDRLRPRQHLKNVRLTCKLFATMAEPRLFRRMVLVPYTDCLQHFARLMRDNPIARHVKTIHYEVRWRYTRGFGPVPTNRATRTIGGKMREFGLLSPCDEGLELMLLSECLKALPFLRRVSGTELLPIHVERAITDSPPCNAPSHFDRLCKEFGEELNGVRFCRYPETNARGNTVTSTKVLLLSCFFAGVKLVELDLHDLDPTIFPRSSYSHGSLKELPMYQSIFGQLKSLRLAFEPSEYINQDPPCRDLANLLTSASKVESLTLILPDKLAASGGWYGLGAEHSWLSPLVRDDDGNGNITDKVILPKLTAFDLSCMVCQEAELVALIRSHRRTLKRLRLSDITLVPEKDDDPSPCWVRLLKEIRPYRIEIALDSHFHNTKCQLWHVELNPFPPAQSLKGATLKWLRGDPSEECPLERAAVKYEATGPDVRPWDELEFRGDHTFEVKPCDGTDIDDSVSDDISEGYSEDMYGDVYDSFDEFWDDEYDEAGYPFDADFIRDSLLDEIFEMTHGHF